LQREGSDINNTALVTVWDPLIRLFHWSLASAFVVSWWTGEEYYDLHLQAGYAALGLVCLRLVLGFFGSKHARFSDFVYSPRVTISYLFSLPRGNAKRYLGHNPAGSWAIFTLLVLAALSGATGWLVLQDFGGKWLEELHEGVASAMLAVVLLHVAGVVVSSWLHRENLVLSMISGMKRARPEDGLRGSLRIVGIALLVAVLAFWVAALRGDLPGLTAPVAEYAQKHDD